MLATEEEWAQSEAVGGRRSMADARERRRRRKRREVDVNGTIERIMHRFSDGFCRRKVGRSQWDIIYPISFVTASGLLKVLRFSAACIQGFIIFLQLCKNSSGIVAIRSTLYSTFLHRRNSQEQGDQIRHISRVTEVLHPPVSRHRQLLPHSVPVRIEAAPLSERSFFLL
jgi:hypothetical protein